MSLLPQGLVVLGSHAFVFACWWSHSDTYRSTEIKYPESESGSSWSWCIHIERKHSINQETLEAEINDSGCMSSWWSLWILGCTCEPNRMHTWTPENPEGVSLALSLPSLHFSLQIQRQIQMRRLSVESCGHIYTFFTNPPFNSLCRFKQKEGATIHIHSSKTVKVSSAHFVFHQLSFIQKLKIL